MNKAPDPASIPQATLGKSLAEIRGRIESADLANLTIDDIQRALRGEQQTNALARLEAWLAADGKREVEIEHDECFVPQPRQWYVTVWTQKERFHSRGISLEPTIHAALDREEEVGL